MACTVETFEGGATRSTETTFDPEGFLNPAALVLFCEYMEKHRFQSDGEVRDSDNWQRGTMPPERAMRGLMRHFIDAWLIRRGYKPKSADCASMADALGGILFNAFVLLKEEVR